MKMIYNKLKEGVSGLRLIWASFKIWMGPQNVLKNHQFVILPAVRCQK